MSLKSFEQLEDIVGKALADLNEKVGEGATILISLAQSDGKNMNWAAKWSGGNPATFGLLWMTDKAMIESLKPKEKL